MQEKQISKIIKKEFFVSNYNFFVKSPLNYIGGKFKLLPQLLPLFPKNIETAVDLFCGGANVGVNLKSKKIILNDKNSKVIELLRLFHNIEVDKIFIEILKIIKQFNLSQSDKFGYEFYGCDSKNGLGNFNKEKYLKLRESYNNKNEVIAFFVLIIFGFNNQIRFNSKGEFNLPCGKRDFNANLQKNLKIFIEKLQNLNINFSNSDFRDFDIKNLNKNDFVYIDPPYFLANATYNENGLWSEKDEKDLLEFIEILNAKNIKFGFSNVILHKEKEHKILQNWVKKNSNFKTYFLNYSYKNCNYQAKNNISKEILITNFKVKK